MLEQIRYMDFKKLIEKGQVQSVDRVDYQSETPVPEEICFEMISGRRLYIRYGPTGLVYLVEFPQDRRGVRLPGPQP